MKRVPTHLLTRHFPLVIVALFTLLSLYFYLFRVSPLTYTVTLTKDGYMPARLSIRTGDTVVFKNETDSLFWPASNLHPTHDIYSEFDPKEPIEKDETWSFTFRKTGEWKYHDHLAPYYEGVITVGEANKPARKQSKKETVTKEKMEVIYTEAKRCKGIGTAVEFKQCWDTLLTDIMETHGLEVAFELVARMYETDPAFGSFCHDMTHKIGQNAYILFARGEAFNVIPKTAYCSYGFYHGFMEALIRKTNDPKQAREFCAYVDEQLKEQTPDAFLQCYHGIGHGWSNNHDEKTWGDDLAMVQPALDMCRRVSDVPANLYRCATGVFNGLAEYYRGGLYKLKIREDDPMWVCRALAKEFHNSCYVSMNVVLVHVTKMDLVAAAKFLEAIPDDQDAHDAMVNLATPVAVAHITEEDFTPYIEQCRMIQERLHIPCIKGLAYAFLEHGEPEREYEKTLGFCRNQPLTQEEREGCYEYIFIYFRQWYPQEKNFEICATYVEEPYRQKCTNIVTLSS